MPDFKFGKTPARTGAVKLKFSKYLADRKAILPQVPVDFGHERLVAANGWGMFGNDQYGDCVWAGAAHETRLWNYEANRSVWFTDKAVLSDYTAVTGFDASKTDANGNNLTDQGTDIQVAAKYRRDTGIVDARGQRHKIAAYLDLEAGNVEEHMLAAYLFSAVGIGIEVPNGFMDQFDKGRPWDLSTAPGASKIQGGHYIPFLSRRMGMLYVVTYGKIWPLTQRAFAKVNDESVAYLTEENLVNGKSPELFDYAALQADLAAITA